MSDITPGVTFDAMDRAAARRFFDSYVEVEMPKRIAELDRFVGRYVDYSEARLDYTRESLLAIADAVGEPTFPLDGDREEFSSPAYALTPEEAHRREIIWGVAGAWFVEALGMYISKCVLHARPDASIRLDTHRRSAFFNRPVLSAPGVGEMPLWRFGFVALKKVKSGVPFADAIVATYDRWIGAGP